MKGRTPRNFDGIQNPGKKISDLLGEIMGEIGRKAGGGQEEIFREWFHLLGEKMGPLTEPLYVKEGVLTVKVKSPTLYSLLCQHEKPRLLRRLKQKFQIRDLIFRVG
ncbi:MAG: hypothetical protein A3E80_02030 [Chlamydiae bacterium RIFCSPHIGHO2_12_FULL_49_9]|nr:MAG: hypothetical protein A3E80_02030 [Chlamydiae bacterium RIFCSPHIGHO2_12_FULL_49_9]